MTKKSQLVKFINIPKIFDDCYLYFAQRPDHIKFPIKRIYFISKRFTKMPRGFHAHKKTKQVLFCIQGSIKITLDNGQERQEVILKDAEKGIYIENKVWHEMHNFKKNTILLVLASRVYETEDYIRDYREFLDHNKKNGNNKTS